MARRGFFAELQHQARVAARERERAHRAAVREHQAAVRLAEQTRRAAQRMQEQLDRAAAAEKKRLEKEAREAYVASREAEVEERNKELEETYADIDSILETTLNVDDFVDLERLRVTAQHPPFDPKGLDTPIPLPPKIPFPEEPTFVPPDPPTGLSALFGKKKYERAVEWAREVHGQALMECQRKQQQVVVQRSEALKAHAKAEAERIAAFEAANAEYQSACEAREKAAAAQNRKLDELIVGLGYGVPVAVQEYVSIVLANSVYPDCFSVDHDFSFESSAAELTLRVSVPEPGSIPTIKGYKYSKSSDEISESLLSQKVVRDRYERAIHQVALRSIHEVFEADRRCLIKTIALTVGTESTDPATGRAAFIPFVVVGAERASFMGFDLSAVVPEATLAHLGAALSKNPYALVSAEARGIRRS